MKEANVVNKWHALFVVTGDEDKVKERLQFRFKNSDLRILVPKRKLKERKNSNWEFKIRTLFPGYVLLNGYIGVEEYYSLKNVPGIIKTLRNNDGLLEISEYEISLINRMICNNDVIGCSNIYVEGSTVIVIDGPLLGMEGYIVSIDKRKGRAKVRLNLMGEARIVELSISIVQAA
jgi:transcription termination/antitermination protein NusG